jgi:hypothetical protein
VRSSTSSLSDPSHFLILVSSRSLFDPTAWFPSDPYLTRPFLRSPSRRSRRARLWPTTYAPFLVLHRALRLRLRTRVESHAISPSLSLSYSSSPFPFPSRLPMTPSHQKRTNESLNSSSICPCSSSKKRTSTLTSKLRAGSGFTEGRRGSI